MTPSVDPDETPAARAHLFLVTAAHDPMLDPMCIGLDLVSSLKIGRGSPRSFARTSPIELELRLDDTFMSKAHARLTPVGGRWLLDDEGSKNGSSVNGVAMRHASLADGDVVELGRTFFLFRDAVAGELSPRPETQLRALAADLDKLAALAPTPVNILISGESGSGKEVLARQIHARSRRPGDFVAVNCGALPPTLVESELFGSKKGAFSGALADREGLIRSADGGTLFLDEIGDLPLPSQAALLRVLQEREVTPVGGTRPVPVDVKLVAATHRDLRKMADEERFRGDLLARLSGFSVELPPLRRRREDLGLILRALLARVAPGRRASLHPKVVLAFLQYAWPANVRELEKCLEAAVVLAGDGPIKLEHLPREIATAAHERPATSEADEEERLRTELSARLKAHKGNVAAVAREMGKGRMQVHRWLRRFNLSLESFRSG